MKNHNQGFVVPLVMAVIFLLGVGGGIYVYNQKSALNSNSASGTRVAEDITSSNQVDNVQAPVTEQTQVQSEISKTASSKSNSVSNSDNIKKTTADKTKILFLADGDTFPNNGPYVFLQGMSAKTNPISVKVNGLSDIPKVDFGSKIKISWNAPGMDHCIFGGFSDIPYVNGGDIGKLMNDPINNRKGIDSVEIYARSGNDYENNLKVNLNCSGGYGAQLKITEAAISIPLNKPTFSFNFITPKTGDTFKYEDKVNITWKSSVDVSTIKMRLYRASDNHEVNPDASNLSEGLRLGQSKNVDWTIPTLSIPPGQYYIKLYELNNVRTDAKTPVFTIQDNPLSLIKALSSHGVPKYTYSDYIKEVENTSSFVINKAYLEQDQALCNTIHKSNSFDLEDDTNKCFLGVAVASGNPKICFNIPADIENTLAANRNSCFYLVAQRNYDVSICDNVKDGKTGTIDSCKALVWNI